ncbi:MAG: hypothetical protein ACU0C9_05020, partial [Paracoccaceae bacterium]
IEAEARSDEDEKRRLIQTCPKVTYVSTDACFSGPMEKVFGLAMAVECDLRGFALAFFVAIRLDPKNAIQILQPYADLRAAWEATLSEMGINPEAMKIAGPPTSSYFELIDDLIPDPDRKKSEELATEMKELFGPA